ncbi:hypothetical protein AMATHDRAFT_5550 [Amanita thiersii Skay4041]|uniref:Multidrug resistance-associated ABC transporter n=1 Tax=Amanita thiersii Skay4041 TaxID=703135 RepID=A0A2A9NKB3_9AGAR|nr:hypothetical protein AMATHDRAFT_5550 [Amanita thiersii Skay4041]
MLVREMVQNHLQLPITISLLVSVFGSLVAFFLTRPKEGKIQLPIHGDGAFDVAASIPDPFDVTTPIDILDGNPIDEDKFWQKICRRKIFISLIVASIVILSTISFGFAVANEERVDAATYVVHVIYSTYFLFLSVRSVKQVHVDGHSESILHMTALSVVATVALGVAAAIPRTSNPVTSSVADEPAVRAIWYGALILYAIACAIVITTPLGPPLHYPPENIYSEKTVSAITNQDYENVCGIVGASVWDTLLFSYTTKVVWLGYTAESLDIGDLPILPGNIRSTFNYSKMKHAMENFRFRIGSWRPKLGSGWHVAYRLARVNYAVILAELGLAAISAIVFYVPPFFLKLLVSYFEVDKDRTNMGWGWVYVLGLFCSTSIVYLITGQLWSIATTVVQVRVRIQLNSILFAKTLVRKSVATASTPKDDSGDKNDVKDSKASDDDDGDFSSKAQVMTLMTTDVDRVSELAWHIFALVDAPIEIVVGTIFLYSLLGVSSFVGLAVTCIFLPLNHIAGKIVIKAQDDLMKARDERVALMNEILGGIRMLKFMAWERSFEARVLKIRDKELKHQKLNYSIETVWNAIWFGAPMITTIISFWHFAVVRQQRLTPSVAFTSILVFSEMRFALNALPETFINMLQATVSLRRIEKYLDGAEVAAVSPLEEQTQRIALQSCTVTWPQDRGQGSAAPSMAATPRQKFVLVDLTLEFPSGELSLICGKFGSGKSLLLLALLGEADILAGQLSCPRSPPNSIASFLGRTIPKDEWIINGLCAYVPQAAWLRNASIKENILFDLPYDEQRYQKTLEVCALMHDLEILEDGDESEIGERGVNLSGGQKARVSLARAIYSRASILLLDDVLSAVDAHTAHHLYNECLKGELTRDRTVILVSHHVQLCVRGASYIVALDNGRVQFAGGSNEFLGTDVIKTLVQSAENAQVDEEAAPAGTIEEDLVLESNDKSESSTIIPTPSESKIQRKPPRKLVEEEKRAVGRIGKDIWETYIWACGSGRYWTLFILVLLIASLTPVFENGWIRYWSNEVFDGEDDDPMFYITVYACITAASIVIGTFRFFVLYSGSIHASTILYKRLLETVLFANIRFHDTVSRGRLLNRFGKDFEGIDSSLSDNFGRSLMYFLSATVTICTVSYVGGPAFIFATFILGIVYYNVAKIYGQTSRDMRRLDSVYRSPLYSIYGETIAGVTVLRAFGASSKFLREMLRCVDTNSTPFYWMWGVNRWLSIRFNLLSSCIVGAIALVSLLTPSINASFAAFALAFASTITGDLLFMVRRFVGLEQSMVAVERVKEYSELKREAPEFVEPRPSPLWPSSGAIECQDLVIRYAPELPDVLHNINFTINAGEKVGILGRTGSGKSTLALSFFRFVEATEGRILVDGLDISTIGLTDLRSKLTIIPQDPTILSGTLRSTLDVFDEYQDAEIYEALRRVHLITAGDAQEDTPDTVNVNVFRNLDSAVNEGGENFSSGEKQLLCMARAILKRSKVLVMDEATASVDYATDELIGKTIRHEFADSTILTIAHRLRTVIDYDRIMLLDQGRVAEFDRPAVLLSNPHSKFHALCRAAGKEEFATLKKMAGL